MLSAKYSRRGGKNYSSYKVGLNIMYFLTEWEGWAGKCLARVMYTALHMS